MKFYKSTIPNIKIGNYYRLKSDASSDASIEFAKKEKFYDKEDADQKGWREINEVLFEDFMDFVKKHYKKEVVKSERVIYKDK